MRRVLILFLTLVLLCTASVAMAETTYLMAGCDGENSQRVWDEHLFFQRMKEKTGISFTFQQAGDFNAWRSGLRDLLKGENAPDVLFKAQLSEEDEQALFQEGLIIDLKPYIDTYAPNFSVLLREHPEWEKAISLPTGEIVALPFISQLMNNNVMWINQKWLESVRLPLPTTAEELTEVLRAFKQYDPNGNGKKDEKPLTFSSMWDLKFLAHAFGIVANDYNIRVKADGTVESVLALPEQRAFLAWLHQLWEEDLLDHSGFITTDNLRRITDSKAAVPYGVMLAPTPVSLVPAESMDQYQVLLPLQYEGQRVYRDLLGELTRGAFAITAQCAHPEELVRWVDCLYTEEGCYLAQAGLEGVEYQWNDDGTWGWVADQETVASTVLRDSAIADGGAMPLLSLASFQEKYEDLTTRRVVQDLLVLKGFSQVPYPQTHITKAQRDRVNTLQQDIGAYADQQMVWFVTGDMPLNDETWAVYVNTLRDKGLDEMVAIMAQSLNN